MDFVFDDDVVSIGRGDENMIVVSDPRVSGVHGRLIRKGSGWLYEDLGSTNGSMIRDAGGKDVVVEPRKNPRVAVGPGCKILLGDVAHPVRLDVLEEKGRPGRSRTADSVWRRSMGDAGQLGTQLVQNPLTSRKILHELFEMFRTLAAVSDRTAAVTAVLDFALSHLDARVVGIYTHTDEALAPDAVRSTWAEMPRLPSGAAFSTLFHEVMEQRLCVVVDDQISLHNSFGRWPAGAVRSAIAAPLIAGEDLVGALFLASDKVYTQFDLDLVTVVAHHASACLHNTALIERLSDAEQKLTKENEFLREVLDRKSSAVGIIGDSVALKTSLKQVRVVSPTDTTVLLLGETGTGKELFARYLHDSGPRRNNVFAAVNCGALAETLLESELFGHKKGAFTGAYADRKGLFHVADGGTLFLDEVGDVSPGLQVKLLRALESGDITPVGSVKPLTVDVRIVAATNKNLNDEVKAGRFREDLLYRINVFPVNLPPLRDRTGDVEILANWFLERFNDKLQKRVTGFAPETIGRLRSYNWPGNVRELQNEIERAVLLSDDGEMILPEVLSERISGMVELPVEVGPLKETMGRLEEQYIVRALKEHGGNRTKTAETLGISRQALTVKLSRYGLVRNR